MSDTPRTDADDRSYPSPEHAQRIRFEGNECVVMHPEEYESLYEKSRQLERELTAITEERDELLEEVKSLKESIRDQEHHIMELERLRRYSPGPHMGQD